MVPNHAKQVMTTHPVSTKARPRESMSAPARPTSTRRDPTGPPSEDGAEPRVRLAAPPLSGLLRIVLILVASALALYLVWRIGGVIQLLGVSLFFALALFPVVDAIAIRTGAPRALVILAVYLIWRST